MSGLIKTEELNCYTIFVFNNGPFNSLHAWDFYMILFSSADFFKNKLYHFFFRKQLFWIQIRSDVMLVLIRIETVCKGCPKTTQVPATKKGVKWSDFVGEDANRDMNLIIYFLIMPLGPKPKKPTNSFSLPESSCYLALNFHKDIFES